VIPLPINAEAPSIGTQPQGAAVTVGTTHSLIVAATSLDGGELSYRWYRNISADNSGGVLIPDATNATYSAPTGKEGTYYYYVVVTNTITDNGDGGVKTAATTSDIATLTVKPLPINAEVPNIGTQPQGATVTVGTGDDATYDLNVAATSPDGGALAYKWYSNTSVTNVGGTLISGATEATYTAPTGTVGTYYYYVVITNAITDNGDGGAKIATTISDVATLTIKPLPINAEAPSIGTQPQDVVVIVSTGDDATYDLNVAATSPDGGTLSYQWYSNASAVNSGGALIPGATNATYTAPASTVGTYYYYVVITNAITDNGDGGVKTAATTSNIVTLTVNLPVIDDKPIIVVAEGKGAAGDTIRIPIRLENNPGIVTIGFDLIFDSEVLKLIDFENTGRLNEPLHPPYNGMSPVRFTWNDGTATINNTNDGDIVILDFEVLTDASPGEYEIRLETVPGSILNASIQQVSFDAINGMITVEADEQAPIDAQTPNIGAGVTVTVGTTHDLTVAATSPDGGVLTYQWYSNTSAINYGGTLIPEATNATYAAPTDMAGTYYYYVVVTNTITDNGDGGVKIATVISNAVTLTVVPPVIGGEPTIAAAEGKGAAGDTIRIPIRLENNPGIVTMGFDIIFNNEALRLVGAENTGRLNEPLHPPHTGTSPIRFAWNDGLASANNINNGDIVILDFEVLADAIPGEYEIRLEIVPESILDAFIQPVSFEVVNGMITVNAKQAFTVSFNLNGGTRTGGGELIQKVTSGGAALAPAVTRTRYTFVGWDKAFGNVTEDVTVTAQWRYNSGVNSTPSSSSPSSPQNETIAETEAPLTNLPPTEPWINPYTDVADTDWFYDAVRAITERGLMGITSPGRFSPNVIMTRAWMVEILYRLEGRPLVSGSIPFTDITVGDWYSDAILWACKIGAVFGYSNGSFEPNNTITREQAMTILYRYAKIKGLDVGASADLSQFTDMNDISDWAMDAVKWTVAAGIINGRTAVSAVPQGNVNRAEIATIFKRYIDEFTVEDED
jgi:uncharacterized protein YfaP (DUF2135 family)